MRLSRIAYKPFVTAGLTGVMFAQSVLAPISAIAEGTGTETDAAHVSYQKASVDTSFSSAAKCLIQRAQNVSSMSVEEAKQLLAGAQALLDRADAAADDASAADSAAGKTVNTANANVTSAQTGVDSADAAVSAELEFHVDALKKKLADAKAKAEELEKQKADAESKKADLENQQKTAQDEADKLQKQLNDANAKLEEAQKKLDALGENPAADEQAAYDEAKKVADEAEAAKKANDELLTKLAGEISANETELDTISADIAEANAKASAWESVFDQQDAEDIVKNGFTGTTDDVEIADVLDFAHGSYEDKVKELEKAKAALDAAKAALDEAKADKATTADKLAAAEVDYALAKDAYDKVKSEVDALLAKQQPTDDAAGTTSMVKQTGVKTASDGKAEAGSSLPQTGDASGAAVAATAAAGLSLVGVAEILRHRNAQQR